MVFLEYRIHPSVGIARMGNAPGHYFVGAEEPRVPVSPQIRSMATASTKSAAVGPGNEFRLASGQIAKQAARFRVWAYYWDDWTGLTKNDHPLEIRECTIADFDFEWKVKVANCKKGVVDAHANKPAAKILKTSKPLPGDYGPPKKIKASGQWLLAHVVLDDEPATRGTLLVMGSEGNHGLKSGWGGTDRSKWTGFARNLVVDEATDDAADGSVEVKVTPKASAPDYIRAVHSEATYKHAWVVIGSPDFGADIEQVVSLYDLALDRGRTNAKSWFDFWGKGPDFLGGEPTFNGEVLPALQSYLDVQDVSLMGAAHTKPDLAALGADKKKVVDKLSPSPDPKLAENIFDTSVPRPATPKIGNKHNMPLLNFLQYPSLKREWLEAWRDNRLSKAARTGKTYAPRRLDEAHMGSMCGGSFFPGIEVGRDAADYRNWEASWGAAEGHIDVRFRGSPGDLTQHLAVPWQKDYKLCASSGGSLEYWPSSRPSIATRRGASSPHAWDENQTTHSDMNFETHWHELGFIRRSAPGSNVLEETERGN